MCCLLFDDNISSSFSNDFFKCNCNKKQTHSSTTTGGGERMMGESSSSIHI